MSTERKNPGPNAGLGAFLTRTSDIGTYEHWIGVNICPDDFKGSPHVSFDSLVYNKITYHQNPAENLYFHQFVDTIIERVEEIATEASKPAFGNDLDEGSVRCKLTVAVPEVLQKYFISDVVDKNRFYSAVTTDMMLKFSHGTASFRAGVAGCAIQLIKTLVTLPPVYDEYVYGYIKQYVENGSIPRSNKEPASCLEGRDLGDPSSRSDKELPSEVAVAREPATGIWKHDEYKGWVDEEIMAALNKIRTFTKIDAKNLELSKKETDYLCLKTEIALFGKSLFLDKEKNSRFRSEWTNPENDKEVLNAISTVLTVCRYLALDFNPIKNTPEGNECTVKFNFEKFCSMVRRLYGCDLSEYDPDQVKCFDYHVFAYLKGGRQKKK